MAFSGAPAGAVGDPCDASLRQLGIDHFDLLQLHAFDALTPVQEALRALDELVKAGEVRYVGVSMAQLDPAAGSEIQNTRPRVVVSPNVIDAHLRTVIGAPMTTGSGPAGFRVPPTFQGEQTLCADINGFSLHAAVRCAADDRQALEQLCRTITRPALANDRVQTNAVGQVVLRLKTRWRDGTTHLVMSPLEFMQRLAVLVPRPRLHLIRFHCVLAPNAKLRALVVPQEPESPAQQAKPAECEANCAHHRAVRLSWARLLKRVLAAT